jgi:hypothetical protein
MEREKTLPAYELTRHFFLDRERKQRDFDVWLIKEIWKAGEVRLVNGKIVKKEEAEGKELDKEFVRVVEQFKTRWQKELEEEKKGEDKGN